MLATRRFAVVFSILTALTLSACGVAVRQIDAGLKGVSSSQLFHQGRHGKLSETEQQWMDIAWNYFKNNSNLDTGLSSSVDKHPSTTMAHIADYIAAFTIAFEFEMISAKEFDERLSALTTFLNQMELFEGKIPNKVYHTETGKMIDYEGEENSIGWSSIDIGRLLTWLNIVRHRFPDYHEYIDKAVMRWDFCEIVDDDGTLYGGTVDESGQLITFQEGRLGYEEYAAHGFAAWGFNVNLSLRKDPYEPVVISGVDLYRDARDPRVTGVLAPVLTTPYAYMGLEFNWDDVKQKSGWDSLHSNRAMAKAAHAVYFAQEARYQQEKIMTARAEHIVTQEPFFLFDSIYAMGYPWNTVGDNGESYPDLALVSTKAAFSMWVLWKTAYTDKLMTVVHQLYNPERGWFEGRYESSGAYERSLTSSTNALIMEALFYKHHGKISRLDTRETYGDNRLKNFFLHPGNCFAEEFVQDTIR